ncbi:hypothetical protein HA466_0111040 [Hirschfeldia incana]|nr:hypothetical protein HA466_0111040 [Hirschfeldia incana]
MKTRSTQVTARTKPDTPETALEKNRKTKNSPEARALPPPRAAAVTYAHHHQTSPETERAHTRLLEVTRRSGETDLRSAETETLTGPCRGTHHHATSRRRITTASFSTNLHATTLKPNA